jgi:multimeric flavodoxin WrbA
MDEVYAAIDSAHAIAISTPVFFATVPAVLKTLYDRFQPYWARRYVLGEPAPQVRRPAALIVVGGGGDPYGMGCAITPTRSVLGPAGFELLEVLEIEGLDGPSAAATHPAELERARALGTALAEKTVART